MTKSDYGSTLDGVRGAVEDLYQEYEGETLTELDAWMRRETNDIRSDVETAEREADDAVAELQARIDELEAGDE